MLLLPTYSSDIIHYWPWLLPPSAIGVFVAARKTGAALEKLVLGFLGSVERINAAICDCYTRCRTKWRKANRV